MLKSLKIEWMKIKNYRVFQVFSGLYLAGILLIIYIFYQAYLKIVGRMQEAITGAQSEGSDLFQLFSSENIWKTVCFATSFLLYLPGMVIIMLFVNEVNFKTHRQNIIDGWKRETFIYSKIGLIFCMTAVVTIMNIIATFIMSRVVHADFSILDGLATLGLSFVQTFIYLMFALFLATLFRRSGIAIIVFFVYGLLLEFFLMWAISKISVPAQYFLPLQVADSLVIFAKADSIYKELPGIKVMLPAALVFAFAYIFFTTRKYKYDDL